jgi:hypothetical protein
MRTNTDFGLTSQEIDNAALALADAVTLYLQGTKTGKGRRTASGFTEAVRGALGRERCSKSLFALVVNRALALRLVERRTSESGRVYLVRPSEVAEAQPQEAESRPPPSREAVPASGGAGLPPTSPYPEDHKCPRCAWRVTLCAHCAHPPWDDELYVNSKGEWRCSSCNDLHYDQSWGGLLRWRHPTKPAPEEAPSEDPCPAPGENSSLTVSGGEE